MKSFLNRLASPLALTLFILTAATGLTARADSGANHRVRLNRPIVLGVSGGNANDRFSRYCCGGTLGALVQDAGGIQYILSNNHVLGLTNRATIGDDILQPGLLDTNCSASSGNVVADLSRFVPISFTSSNQVDAAIAQVRAGQVDSSGAIMDIGAISTQTVAPTLGMAVKKSGRTTGFTTGQISAVNVTVNITYPSRCGSNTGSTATFVNQVLISPGTFSAGGDSGSVIVENVANSPRATALLFAGSSSYTIANPIGPVLSAFQVSMAGGGGTPTTGSIAGAVTGSSNNSPIAGATVSTSTGQSANTAADGSYSISNVPTGTVNVTASASGFASQTQSASVQANTVTTVNFALAPQVVPTTAIVDCITYTTSGGQGGTRDLRIAVKVVNDFGGIVAGASVSVALTFPNGSTGTANGTTDSSGNANFSSRNASNGCYSTSVTAVSAAGLAWNGQTPANGFNKGVDSTPDADCRSGSTPCGAGQGGTNAPGTGKGRTTPRLEPLPSLAQAIDAKRQIEPGLLTLPDVVGVGVAHTEDGTPVIQVYLDKENSQTPAQLPAKLGDVPVQPIVTGPFIAN